MNEAQVLAHIDAFLGRTLRDKGLEPPRIEAATQLLGGALRIDSLDLALLVRELEEFVGHDPFEKGFIEFRTAGELARLYTR